MSQTSPARVKAIIASLIHRFHLSIAEVANLTDWQIIELYWHRVEEDGSIPIPDPSVDETPEPMTLQEELRALDQLIVVCRTPPEQAAELKQKLRDKYARLAGSDARTAEQPGTG